MFELINKDFWLFVCLKYSGMCWRYKEEYKWMCCLVREEERIRECC